MKKAVELVALAIVFALASQGYSEPRWPILYETPEEIIMQNSWIAVKILTTTGEISSFIYLHPDIPVELLTDTAYITIRDKRADQPAEYRQSEGRVVGMSTGSTPDSVWAIFGIDFKEPADPTIRYSVKIKYTLDIQALRWNAILRTYVVPDTNWEANIDFYFPAIANMEYAFWTKDEAPFKLPMTKTLTYRVRPVVLPALVLYNESKDLGLSFVSPFEVRKPKLQWEMKNNSFIIANRYLRLSRNHPCTAGVYIVPHEGCWRPGLAWIYNKYPAYFNPVSDTVLKGEGWYFPWDIKWNIDTAIQCYNVKERGVTWVELHGHMPFLGVYVPNREALRVTSKDTWNVIIDRDDITYERWRDSLLPETIAFITSYDSNRAQIRRWDSAGIQPYIYFSSFESWHQYASGIFPGDFAAGPDREPLPAWIYCYLMNPDPDSSWGRHIILQLDSLLYHYDTIEGYGIKGIFYDRDDYCDYDYNHWDGVTMIGPDSVYMLGFAQQKINDSITNRVHQLGKGVWTNGPTSIEVCKNMDGIMSEDIQQAPFQQYFGISRPLILLPYDTTPQQTETKLKTALWTGHFPSIAYYRAESTCREIEKKYRPLFSLYKSKKWVLYPKALQLPEGIKGNIFKTPIPSELAIPDTDYLVPMIDPELFSSKIYPKPETTHDIFRYDRWAKVRVPDSAEIKYCYFLSGDYKGINQDTIFEIRNSKFKIQIPLHRASTLVQLSKKPRYEITRISSPVLVRGDSGKFVIKVHNIGGEPKDYYLDLITRFGSTSVEFHLEPESSRIVRLDFMIPDTWSLGEETMKVIEANRNDTTIFTAWVVDKLTFQLPEKLFIHFAYRGDTIPFKIVNNTKESLKVRLSGKLRGVGIVKFGTYPSQLPGEEVGIYPPFQDTLEIDLKSLQVKELVVFILAQSRFDTVKICTKIKKEAGIQPESIIVIRQVERAMKIEEGDLFYDDFSSGNMNKWQIISSANSWEVVDSVAKGDKDSHMAFAPLHLTPEWTNYEFQVNSKLESSSNPVVDWIKSFVYFRVQNESTYYRFGITKGFMSVSLWKRVNWRCKFLTKNEDFNIKKGIWYNLRVEVNYDSIRCFLDGEQVINVRDSIQPLLEGGIGIGVTEDAYVNYYDDVVVRKIPISP